MKDRTELPTHPVPFPRAKPVISQRQRLNLIMAQMLGSLGVALGGALMGTGVSTLWGGVPGSAVFIPGLAITAFGIGAAARTMMIERGMHYTQDPNHKTVSRRHRAFRKRLHRLRSLQRENQRLHEENQDLRHEVAAHSSLCS